VGDGFDGSVGGDTGAVCLEEDEVFDEEELLPRMPLAFFIPFMFFDDLDEDDSIGSTRVTGGMAGGGAGATVGAFVTGEVVGAAVGFNVGAFTGAVVGASVKAVTGASVSVSFTVETALVGDSVTGESVGARVGGSVMGASVMGATVGEAVPSQVAGLSLLNSQILVLIHCSNPDTLAKTDGTPSRAQPCELEGNKK